MVIAPIGARGEATAPAPLAIPSTAIERIAGLLIIALLPACECLNLVCGVPRAPPLDFQISALS
jgi:hypothetical protein